MALKTTKTRKRKRRVKAAPKPVSTKPKVQTARRVHPSSALKRTSMWLGEDLLVASKAEADRLGISRALLVQTILRTALGLPALQIEPRAMMPETSVFG